MSSSTTTHHRPQEKFHKDNQLPFAECRHSRRSRARFKPHMHSTFSVGAVDSGSVEYSVGTYSARLEPGSLALINPEVLHCCNGEPGKERSYYMLYLETQWCLTLQRSLWQVPAFLKPVKIKLDSWQLYHQYRHVMQLLMSHQSHLQEKEHALVCLFSEIFQACCEPGQSPAKEPAGNTALLKDILRQDLQKDFTLNSLADTLATNPYTMLRRFKAETGITPHAFRMNCRIEQAKKLLRQGGDIPDVAIECGFFDQSHLHRHFKAITTITPLRYKRNFVQ